MSKRAIFANIVLGSLSIICLLMFFYFLLKSQQHPPGQMNIYYGFTITGFLFFTYVLLKWNVELKVKCSLLILSFVLSIYLIEIILSYNKTSRIEHKRAKLAEEMGIPYDLRSRYEVMSDYRNNGIDAFLFYNPIFHNPNEFNKYEEAKTIPLSFISGKTSIHCNESGVYLIYKTDEHGFNNPEGLYDEKSIDNVLIGDSFIKGSCVKREENIAGNLMERGNKVLNLGMGNTGPLSQLAILKEYGKPVKPKKVFWFFYEGNDYEGFAFEKKWMIFLKYLDKDFSQDLIYKQKLVDEILIEYMEKELALLKEKPKLMTGKKEDINKASFHISLSSLKLLQLRRRLGMIGIGICECKIDPLYKDIFTEAKRVTNSWGGQLIFVYLPEWSRYSERINYCRKRFLNTGKIKILSVIKDLHIPIIDIESVFDSHPDTLSLFPFRVYGHYNSKGYKLVAETIDQYLLNDRENVEEHR